jgi:muramoyltetrapeptide carboxypeptidase LdcA involved in peptidoglycan recycling
MTRMAHDLIRPPKARRGDRIAVLSPSFAAAGAFPAVHEQAMRRLTEVTGLIPVEYPTTREVGATPQARAADINAAFADPAIRGILTVVGGEDQLTVIPHLDAGLARRDPKPFLGMSDNTNIHHWLWANGIASFYGGSSQVHLGPGPGVDDVHARSLRAALVTGETLQITDPGESELLPARNAGWIVRALGERGILETVGAVLVGRPPVSDSTRRPPAEERARLRAEQRDVVVELIGRYNPEAVVCVGIPFGHTRPQWILPHGGAITVDGTARQVVADYA